MQDHSLDSLASRLTTKEANARVKENRDNEFHQYVIDDNKRLRRENGFLTVLVISLILLLTTS